MPRPPKTKTPEEALERLQDAREDFAQAFEGILCLLDLSPFEQALADRRQAAEAFQQEAQAGYDEAQAYFDDRSETWQESEKGQAFAIWIGEFELLADFAGEPTDEGYVRSTCNFSLPGLIHAVQRAFLVLKVLVVSSYPVRIAQTV
jgi:hypothetical protein